MKLSYPIFIFLFIIPLNLCATEIKDITFPNSCPQFSICEISFSSSNDPYLNPFDPDIVDIKITVNPPTGSPITVYAFWFQDYDITGGDTGWENYTPKNTPQWRARYAPTVSGEHSFFITLKDSSGTVNSATYQFNVNPSRSKGFLSRHNSNYKYLQFSNGDLYLPIGHNVAFREGAPTSSKDGTVLWEEYYSRMEINGENWSRLWMTDLDRNTLEWDSSLFYDYKGLGKYSLVAAYRIDKNLEIAGQHGIYVQLVLHDHGQFSTHVNARWSSNPYNSSKGGLVSNPNYYFSDDSCKIYTKKRLRYIAARYSAYSSLLAYELFNEIQFTGNGFEDSFRTAYNDAALQNSVETWHKEMALHLKNHDPYKHLITTSSDDDNKDLHPDWTNLNDVWADANFDLIQIHHYRNTTGMTVADRDSQVMDRVNFLRSSFHKPVWCAEFGIGGFQRDTGGNEDPDACWTLDGYDPVNSPALFNPDLSAADTAHLNQGTHLHNLLWSGLVSESVNAYWWWGRYIHEDNARNRTAANGFPLYYHYKIARAYLNAVGAANWGMQNLVNPEPVISGDIKVFGSKNKENIYLFIRDKKNDFGTGYAPGNLVPNRTLENAEIIINDMENSKKFNLTFYDTWDNITPLRIIKTNEESSSTTGSIKIKIPPFQRDIAVYVVKKQSSIGNWKLLY